jgi:hypothetical protein
MMFKKVNRFICESILIGTKVYFIPTEITSDYMSLPLKKGRL